MSWFSKLQQIESKVKVEILQVEKKFPNGFTCESDLNELPVQFSMVLIPTAPEILDQKYQHFPYLLGIPIDIVLDKGYPESVPVFKLKRLNEPIWDAWIDLVEQQVHEEIQKRFVNTFMLRNVLRYMDRNIQRWLDGVIVEKEPCMYYARGWCRYGKRCKGSHDIQKHCRFFKAGKCKKGDKCKFYHHVDDKAVDGKKVVEQTFAKENSELDVVKNNVKSWTMEEQHLLDGALKVYALGSETRWEDVANRIPGRTPSDCECRYAKICAMIRRKKQQSQDVGNIESSKDSPVLTSIELEAPKNATCTVKVEQHRMHKVDTMHVHRAQLMAACLSCPYTFTVHWSRSDADINKWCPRCSVLHKLRIIPILLHPNSNTVLAMQAAHLAIVDVSSMDVMALCSACTYESLILKVKVQIRAEESCRQCFTKLAFEVKSFIIENSTNLVSTDSKPVKSITSKLKTLTVGQPLPRYGACDHYTKSNRWFRFQCCGKLFPCDVCHDADAECSKVNTGVFASKMICGMCSLEQSSANKVCSCGNAVGKSKSKSSHWEGGKGCRNKSAMHASDSQKHKGSKKTQSNKLNRVGLAAKIIREAKTKVVS